MSIYRISYRPMLDGTPLSWYQSQTVEADSTNEAIRKLQYPYWTIRSITIQCAATTKSGDPCQRFTHEEYCSSHRSAA